MDIHPDAQVGQVCSFLTLAPSTCTETPRSGLSATSTRYVPLAPCPAKLRAELRSGDHVYIGVHTSIIGTVTIGDGATIAANTLVISDVPPGATAMTVCCEFCCNAKEIGGDTTRDRRAWGCRASPSAEVFRVFRTFDLGLMFMCWSFSSSMFRRYRFVDMWCQRRAIKRDEPAARRESQLGETLGWRPPLNYQCAWRGPTVRRHRSQPGAEAPGP